MEKKTSVSSDAGTDTWGAARDGRSMKIRGAGKKSGGFGADEHNQKKARAHLGDRDSLCAHHDPAPPWDAVLVATYLSFHQGAVISPCLVIAFFFSLTSNGLVLHSSIARHSLEEKRRLMARQSGLSRRAISPLRSVT